MFRADYERYKKDTVVCNPGILGSGILATNLFQKSNAVIQDYSKKLVEIYKNAQYKNLMGVYIMIP